MIKKVTIVLILVAVFVFPLIILVFYTFAPGWTYPNLVPKSLIKVELSMCLISGTKL